MINSIERATSVVCWKKTSILKYAVSIIVVILLSAGLCPAQTQFALAVGGLAWDKGYSIAINSDGGYIVTGETGSFGADSSDLFLAKFNSSGNLTWAKTVGGADWDYSYSVAPTSDGGYIATGRTWCFGAGWDDLFRGWCAFGPGWSGRSLFPWPFPWLTPGTA